MVTGANALPPRRPLVPEFASVTSCFLSSLTLHATHLLNLELLYLLCVNPANHLQSFPGFVIVNSINFFLFEGQHNLNINSSVIIIITITY